MTDGRGNTLQSFEVLSEEQLVQLDPSIPLPLSLVVLWYAGRCLMVFDRWKQEWELPGDDSRKESLPAWRRGENFMKRPGSVPMS